MLALRLSVLTVALFAAINEVNIVDLSASCITGISADKITQIKLCQKK